MKVKVSIFLIIMALMSFVGIVYYYGFEWNNLLSLAFYENLANPSMRIVKVQEGFRKEEVADTLALKLGWNNSEKKEFLNAPLALGKTDLEGYYFPKSYLIHKDTDPVSVTQLMVKEFNKETKDIKKSKNKIINQDTALKVASIIQREAAGKGDMRLISGILWNRLFKGMKLQVDATLQYAKGNENDWWPEVKSKDKNIKSPYNTYMHADLPPTPISNPGLAAIQAAYNPLTTNCLFFIHDKKGNIHCSATYAQHLKNIDKYY